MQITPFDHTDDNILKRLKNVPAFDCLPDSHIREFMQAASVCRYEAGETIITEGEYDNRLFFLIFGKLTIWVGGNQIGKLQRLGDVFGDMGIIDGSPRTATIKAEKSALAVSLDSTAIKSFGSTGKIFTQAVMYRVFSEVLANRLREAYQMITDLQKEADKLAK